jgi:hypothetical protein
MKKRALIIMALVTSLSGLWAQENSDSASAEAANSIGIYWGTGNLEKQDLIFSPFVHQTWSPVNFTLNYERSAKLEQRATIRFGSYKAHTGDLFSYQLDGETYPKLEHSFTRLDLNYSLGAEVAGNDQWKFILGGRFRNRFQISNYDYSAAGSFGYCLPIGLDGWFNLGYEPEGKHRFEMNLYLPLFSYVARSPYMGQDDEYMERISVHGDLKIFLNQLTSGQIQSWGTSQIVDLDLGYRYAISDRWELGAAYLFSMNLHSTPVRLSSYENLFLIGFRPDCERLKF